MTSLSVPLRMVRPWYMRADGTAFPRLPSTEIIVRVCISANVTITVSLAAVRGAAWHQDDTTAETQVMEAVCSLSESLDGPLLHDVDAGALATPLGQQSRWVRSSHSMNWPCGAHQTWPSHVAARSLFRSQQTKPRQQSEQQSRLRTSS